MHQAVAEHAKEYARIQRFNLVRCIRLYWMRRFWFRCCHEAILQREFERFSAAVQIQCAFHGRQGRRRAKRARRRHAAIRIAVWGQTWLRGARSRVRYLKLKRRHDRKEAALKIQGMFRTSTARRQIEAMLADRDNLREIARAQKNQVYFFSTLA